MKTLPPDPEGQNDGRAGWAFKALSEFMWTTRCEPKDVLPDLLCNLMHLCDRDGSSFEAQLQRARVCYAEETTET